MADALYPNKKIGAITVDTLVWKAGMAQWVKAREVDELKRLFSNEIPPIPPQN